jgi:hypothetical protein
MRVKSVLADEGGGAHPPPLITFTLTSKVAVYAPAEWADILTLFHLYQYMYSVGDTKQPSNSSRMFWRLFCQKRRRFDTTHMPKK